jgi:hypothetical protein
MKRTVALLAMGFCLLGSGNFVGGSEPGMQATDKAVESRKSPDGPKGAVPDGNGAVTKAVVEYAKKMAEIGGSDATQAQKEAAYAKARQEITTILVRQRVVIDYTVEDVTIVDDNTARLKVGSGIIKSSLSSNLAVDHDVQNVPPWESVYILVRMRRATALQINKESHISLAGTLGLRNRPGEILVQGRDVLVPKGYTDLGKLYLAEQKEQEDREQREADRGPWERVAPRTTILPSGTVFTEPGGYFRPHVEDRSITRVIIRDDYVGTLDGSRVEVVLHEKTWPAAKPGAKLR